MKLFTNLDKVKVKLLLFPHDLTSPFQEKSKGYASRLTNKEVSLVEQLVESSNDLARMQVNDENVENVNIAINLPHFNQCDLCQKYSESSGITLKGIMIATLELNSFYQSSKQHAFLMRIDFVLIWIFGVLLILFGYFRIKKNVKKRLDAYQQATFNLVHMLEQRDSYTSGHSSRVAEYALLIAKKMKLTEEDETLLYRAAMLHDIGKISTPDSVLLKPGKLTLNEFTIMQQHVTSSYDILNDIALFRNISIVVRSHHERFDGKGYPDGLNVEQTPLLSQILTVADSFDAMTSQRIYKPRMTVAEALEELSRCSGTQFNPKIIVYAKQAFSKLELNIGTSQLPQTLLEHQRFSIFYKDIATDVFNHHYLELLFSMDEYIKKFKYLCVIQLHNVHHFNKQFGWLIGNDKLTELAKKLLGINKNQLVFRIFGDDFALLLQCKMENAHVVKLMDAITEGSLLEWSKQYIKIEDINMKSIADLETIIGDENKRKKAE